MAYFGKPEYWEDKYQKEIEQFDWYQRYSGIKSILTQHIKPEHQILNVGLSEEMYKDGYQHITNIDISPSVIKHLQERYKEESANMKFHVMDARKLEFNVGTFDIAIDKGTLDALLCGEGSNANVELMLNEIYKVLAPSGIYICVSHGIPEKREKFFQKPTWDWMLTTEKIPKMGIEVPEKTTDPKKFHYIYILKKQGSTLPPPKSSEEQAKEDKEDNQ